MKNKFIIFILIILTVISLTLTALAVRKEGVRGNVESVDSNRITVSNKTYRFNKHIRVVVISRNGIHHYEKLGSISDIRVGDKVYAVVIYDEMMDISLERY